MKTSRFRTLHAKFLLPLLCVAIAAAIGVAVLSFWLGQRWAMHEVHRRFENIARTLGTASFPLHPTVLRSIAELSGSELATVDDQGVLLGDTLENREEVVEQLQSVLSTVRRNHSAITVLEKEYLAFSTPRLKVNNSTDSVDQIFVLFDLDEINRAGHRAAALPLLTGISTIVLLSIVMAMSIRRLAKRLIRLQQNVQLVSEGNFDIAVGDDSVDEVGQLGAAVDSMSGQLTKLWNEVNRQQGAKLLHQIAGGMAHQLRNTLTGSRMAIELHHRHCPADDKDDVEVAISQMEVAEDYVHRLLMLGSGKQQETTPASVRQCLQDVRRSHVPIAKHLRVDLLWDDSGIDEQAMVADGSNFSAAIANLILNALQTSTSVQVIALLKDESVLVDVIDNGPGVDQSIADELFEPFATTKPEGMGLGLPLVKRVADQLGGTVSWQRREQQTCFRFECKRSDASRSLENHSPIKTHR